MAGTLELYAWVERAVKHIRFLPDRFGVRWELQNHMEDRYEALTAGGLDERAAAEQTVAAMGDADEVGRALNRLHSPLLGWAWLLSCAAVFLALLLCLSHMAFRPETTTEYPMLRDSGAFTETERSVYDKIDQEEHIQTRTRLWESGAAGTCGDYTFTVPKAALWTHTGVDDGRYDLYLQFRAARKFWTPHLRWNAVSAFWFADSLGNRYDDCGGDWYPEEYMASARTLGLDLVLYDFPPDAEWVELHYHREGYDLVLRVDLKGGDAS